jgi:hypothetical protein
MQRQKQGGRRHVLIAVGSLDLVIFVRFDVGGELRPEFLETRPEFISK